MILLLAEFLPPKKIDGAMQECRHIVSVFKLVQDLLEPSDTKGKSRFQVLMGRLPPEHKARWFAGAALNTSEQAMVSVLSTVLPRLNTFLDTELDQTICFDSLLDAESFASQNSAIFLVLPEEDQTKNFTAGLMIQNLSLELFSMADENGGKPKNRVVPDSSQRFPKVLRFGEVASSVRHFYFAGPNLWNVRKISFFSFLIAHLAQKSRTLVRDFCLYLFRQCKLVRVTRFERATSCFQTDVKIFMRHFWTLLGGVLSKAGCCLELLGGGVCIGRCPSVELIVGTDLRIYELPAVWGILSRGDMMRKFMLLAAGLIAVAVILLSTGAAAESNKELPQDTAKQVILRLLHQPVREAVNDYYDGPRQYWREEVLNAQKFPQSPYYEIVIRVETFYGPHNPPYGLETMTFHVSPLGEVQLVNFDHQDEPD